jgi:ribosomal protein S18 acetylase RimI-like enzyme
MITAMQIRPFHATDQPAVLALWKECRLTRPWNDPHKDIARKLAVQPELFLVGLVKEDVIATVMAGYEGHRGWVNYLAVAPAFRGRRCPKVSLLVRTSNLEAVAFYRHLGYVQDEAVSLGKRLIMDEPA